MIVLTGSESGTTELSIAACQIGRHLTAGRGELRIRLCLEDPGFPVSLAALLQFQTLMDDAILGFP